MGDLKEKKKELSFVIKKLVKKKEHPPNSNHFPCFLSLFKSHIICVDCIKIKL